VSLTRQLARVETGSPDEEGCLIFFGEKLVAVLVRLSTTQGDLVGRWYLEKGFGRLDGPDHPSFANLDAAQDWITLRLAEQAECRIAAPQR
jgi:hypothetical protein